MSWLQLCNCIHIFYHVSKFIHCQSESEHVSVLIVVLNVVSVGLPDDLT